MIRLLKYCVFITLTLTLQSCFKEDEKVTPHSPGDAVIDTVGLTNLYKYQIYYKLSDVAEVTTNFRKDWDMAFESTDSGYHIRLNTSCFMYAAGFSGQDFGILIDTTHAKWAFDPSNGNRDSTAIGSWFTINSDKDTVSDGRVFLINRGIDENGNERGFRQLIIDSLSDGIYYIRTCKMNGSDQKQFSIPKSRNQAYVLCSLDAGVTLVQEPPSDQWDLLFSQYTTLLYTDLGEPYPYLVTGVLINPDHITVAYDSLSAFDQISLESTTSLRFSKTQDIIGYDWKYYDFDAGSYTVDINKVYILRDKQGFTYKLRFLGFYNQAGEKGFPSFEFRRL